MTSNSSLDGTGSVSTYQLQDSTPIITGQAADLNPGKHKFQVFSLTASANQTLATSKQWPGTNPSIMVATFAQAFFFRKRKNKILHPKYLYSCLLSVKLGKIAIVVKVNHSNRAANDAVESKNGC